MHQAEGSCLDVVDSNLSIGIQNHGPEVQIQVPPNTWSNMLTGPGSAGLPSLSDLRKKTGRSKDREDSKQWDLEDLQKLHLTPSKSIKYESYTISRGKMRQSQQTLPHNRTKPAGGESSLTDSQEHCTLCIQWPWC